VTNFMKSIDWDLLYKQKLLLEDTIFWSLTLSDEVRDAMAGVMSILDELHTEAEERGLWSPPPDDLDESGKLENLEK